MKRAIHPISDELVTLRLLAEGDLPTTLAWRNNDEARKWFINSDKIELSNHLKWFGSYKEKTNDFVFVVEANGSLVGQCAVYGIDGTTQKAEVGRFLVAPEHAGKGYIKHGCQLLIQICWEHLSLEKLFLEVFESNSRAINLYEKLGFRETSTRDNLKVLELNRR